MAAVRIERDSLGEVEVPAEAWWAAQTQRSLELTAMLGSVPGGPLENAQKRSPAPVG